MIVFVCYLEFAQFRVHIVPCFGKEGFYLLNHNINRRSWSAIKAPILPTLGEVVGWSTDPIEDSTNVDEEAEAALSFDEEDYNENEEHSGSEEDEEE